MQFEELYYISLKGAYSHDELPCSEFVTTNDDIPTTPQPQTIICQPLTHQQIARKRWFSH